MRRPGGITTISILLWITGVLNVVAGMGTMEDISATAGTVQVLTGSLAIVCGWGCWGMRSWARITTVAMMAVNAAALLLLWMRYSDRIIVSRVLLPLIINVGVIAYLMRADIRQAFARVAVAEPDA